MVLNRTYVYASLRRPLKLGFHLRLALRIVPIILFFAQAKNTLEAMRCQTSLQYSELKYGSSLTSFYLDFAGDGGLLYYLSSSLLFWKTDEESCRVVGMIKFSPMPEILDHKGSLSLLWPLFQCLCLGQFVEAFSCAIQGRRVMVETMMSIFEYSLACAEAEAMVINRVTIGFQSLKIPREIGLASRSALLGSLNTSPEVLLMGLIESLNHLTSHVLGLFELQAKFRLLNTGLWGLCFMGVFVLGFFSSLDAGADISRFPTICVIGFIPQFVVCIGMGICGGIYLLAILLSLFSPPDAMPPPASLSDRLKVAHRNLQANAPLSKLRLEMKMDFNSALMRVGLAVMIIAHKALYLNEKRAINVSRLTWLEEERLQELESSHQAANRIQHDMAAQAVNEEGALPESDDRIIDSIRARTNGYAREATTESLSSSGTRHGYRHAMTRFLLGLFFLVVRLLALITVKVCDAVGIHQMRRFAYGKERQRLASNAVEGARHNSDADPSELLLNMSLVDHEDKDFEAEIKGQITADWGEDEERKLDLFLYDWWARGPTWGERDSSGTYEATDVDEDATSIISAHSDDDEQSSWQSDNDNEDKTTDHVLDPSHLARLLAPTDPADRQEAEILAHHLTSDRIVTRSTYRRSRLLDRARVLTSTRYKPISASSSPGLNLPLRKLSPEEEESILEQLIVSRRSAASSSQQQTWLQGAEGLGAGGPQCVVCQASPRTILVWPCRCLSLCEECRVSLAVNDFGTCVCCRQEVFGFSRLFVP